MPTWGQFVTSSIGKKIVMGITGLVLVLFLVGHLLGNLTLFCGNPDLFNKYSHKLISMGPLLILVELVLLLFFLAHLVSGISVVLKKRRARPIPYSVNSHAGGASRKTLSSTSMILTGLVLFVFTVVHLKTFKFGPHYETEVGGVVMRDLHTLVVEKFSHLPYVVGYVVCMVFLGFHLRHGFWSAFQSLGALRPRYSSLIYGSGVILAILLSLGFLILPVWIYITGGAR